jgi:2-polyprenyl-3-methyl-5-hydroxy-6-metoxy-1,4-benzoquinol methylase
MFEKIENCPVCKNSKLENFIICKDHLLTDESFAITKCTNCSFLFTNPRPVLSEIGKYYQSDQYISHSDESKTLTDFLYKLVRKYTLWNKLRLVNSLTRNKTILDFGCGTGDFLKTCQNNSWEIHGFEPDKNARQKAIEKNKIEILTDSTDLSQLPRMEIITLWHVLEHIHNLNETIDNLKNKLTKTGKLIIAVPNIESFDAKLYKEYWAAYDVPRHLYHFSMKTMKLLMHNHGLKIYQTIPMKLDAFYVSLLSEKYVTRKSNYIKSLITGYKSNRYAIKNKNNYSSLIYITGK